MRTLNRRRFDTIAPLVFVDQGSTKESIVLISFVPH
jgi:hypothetical protein